MFRLIFSVLVVLVCVGGYLVFDRGHEANQDAPDASQTQSAAPAATPSQDDNNLKDLKVN